jgi:hypothetical protein
VKTKKKNLVFEVCLKKMAAVGQQFQQYWYDEDPVYPGTDYPAPSILESETVDNESNSGEFGLKVAAGAALAAGVSALIFTNWEKIERYLKWGKLANEAAADSVLLLETKMDRAIALCDAQQVDADALKHAISSAHDEARNLVAINQQLRDRLKGALSVNHSKFF